MREKDLRVTPRAKRACPRQTIEENPRRTVAGSAESRSEPPRSGRNIFGKE
jgi:hypothetical protein